MGAPPSVAWSMGDDGTHAAAEKCTSTRLHDLSLRRLVADASTYDILGISLRVALFAAPRKIQSRANEPNQDLQLFTMWCEGVGYSTNGR